MPSPRRTLRPMPTERDTLDALPSGRAAVYLRISLDKDGDEAAVARQRVDARDLAAKRGWEIVEEYLDNSVSASKASVVRPSYEAMRRDYRSGLFDVIICYDLDRLTRQPRQLEDWIDEAEHRGLVLVTLNGEADLSTDNGRMFARIKVAVARGEIERKSARQKRANEQHACRGAWQFSRRPYGYERVGGRIHVVESEAEIVREGYRRYIAGESYYALANDWNAREVPTFDGPWSMTRVRALLRNERYAGLVLYKGQPVELEEGYSISWEPLIDRRTWDDYLATRSARKRAGSWSTKAKHLLSGIISCAVCGAPLTARPEYDKLKDGTRNTRMTYACTAPGKWCVTIGADDLDEFVQAVVLGRLADKKVVAALRRTPDLAPLHDEIAAIDARWADIVDLYDAGAYPRAKYREEGIALNARRTAAAARLEAAQRESPLTDLVALRGSIPARWRKLDLIARRRIIAELGLQIAIAKGRRGRRPLDPATGRPVFDTERVQTTWAAA